jgi:hypothetical protein
MLLLGRGEGTGEKTMLFLPASSVVLLCYFWAKFMLRITDLV